MIADLQTYCRRIIFFAVLLLLPNLATAHDSEPINTDFASPLARGTANVNFDVQHFRNSTDEELGALGFEYGIARRMQFSVDMPLARRMYDPAHSVIGSGNLSIAYRYLLAGGNERPFAISINPEVGLPTGNHGAADAAYTAGAAIHADAHHGDKLWLHSNWGYETPVSHFDEKEKDFNFAVAGMYEVTEKLHSVLEVFGNHDFTSSLSRISVAPEMIYALGEHWELKAAVPIGTTSSTPSVGLQFRVTWKIGPSERQ